MQKLRGSAAASSAAVFCESRQSGFGPPAGSSRLGEQAKTGPSLAALAQHDSGRAILELFAHAHDDKSTIATWVPKSLLVGRTVLVQVGST